VSTVGIRMTALAYRLLVIANWVAHAGRPRQHPPTTPRARPPHAAGRHRPAEATPTGHPLTIPTHSRVRHDEVDKAGNVTVRHNSRLHHIGIHGVGKVR